MDQAPTGSPGSEPVGSHASRGGDTPRREIAAGRHVYRSPSRLSHEFVKMLRENGGGHLHAFATLHHE